MNWKATLLGNGERHVYPLDDFRPHDETPACWCKPFEDDGIWVHNALDQRELVERNTLMN